MARRLVAFHLAWDGVIGPDAAQLRYATWQARLVQSVSLVILAVVAIVEGSARSLAHTALAVVWIVFLANAVLWFLVWARRRRLQYAAASRFLGVDIRARNFPRSNPHQFEKWCYRHGVVPPTASESSVDG
jgi:hypothetical protein